MSRVDLKKYSNNKTQHDNKTWAAVDCGGYKREPSMPRLGGLVLVLNLHERVWKAVFFCRITLQTNSFQYESGQLQPEKYSISHLTARLNGVIPFTRHCLIHPRLRCSLSAVRLINILHSQSLWGLFVSTLALAGHFLFSKGMRMGLLRVLKIGHRAKHVFLLFIYLFIGNNMNMHVDQYIDEWTSTARFQSIFCTLVILDAWVKM